MGHSKNRQDGWEPDDWNARDWNSIELDENLELDEEATSFEKITRRQKAALPVSSSRVGGRSAKETAGSRKVRRSISKKAGGIHRRRIKKIL